MRKKLLIAAAARLSFRSIQKPPSFDVSNSVGPLYVQSCGWAYAASVSSDMPNAPKGRKKIRQCERRAMVESYVNKYRTINAGKFPTTKDVQRQVGGGFYFVREIIQELEYKSRTNSSKEMDENLLEQKKFNESKLQITVARKVSSDNTGSAKERTAQDDSQSIGLDEQEIINAGCDHLKVNRQSRMSYEAEIIYAPDAPTNQLLQERRKSPSSPSSDNNGNVYDKAEGHVSEFVETENHQVVEERCIGKEGYEKRGKAPSGDIYGETSHSTLQVPKDVRSGNDMPSYSSASVTPERHKLNEETEDVSASSVKKSSSSHSKARSHDSEFVDMEKHPILEEKSFRKAGYEAKEQSAVKDDLGIPNHKLEQYQGSSEFNESKINSDNRETSGVLASKKPTLWGNLKSLANGIINIWKKF
ncbi:hypothetical protein HN51_008234 [Arachis hypogaea]|uniref:AT3G52170-like helix-turn-helix domain-containing protein n=4 Tax=Arachis hypogaea TaxID=3818 RepID=A0A445D4H3_ARAHY|nr:uncharacterized protein LOC112801799 isoform X1 [Arachis hypogaea]XP_025700505.1 uncharacterized protein LOC112801799 isoform X1 [Arachis hypogaea]XP_025700506.1 uncharacterized protein LOC112801799 isoform X1 [Arachis hypogaea]XP_025700507.1 uncharacterized protein LOC112801799 isoform X1 [Arachis hypogaea]XP_025700508.1 uncharacterized protein LOC112801799 isoform X1 [Arachis hypogaea]XP_025700509.1 uncharacterized protein LOC112801799 isoform X1 [Arachis hypogaea]XP_025700511.1 uncharac